LSVRSQGARAAEWTDGIDEEVTVTASRETGRRSIASNRRARRDYTILKTYDAGIVLVGDEVKSLRAGHASLAGAFVHERDGELMLHGLHIPEHAHGRHGTRVLDQPRRTRKLLMHRSEIDKIIARLGEAGVTLVPLSLYFQNAGRRWRSPWRAAGGPTTSGRQSPSGAPTGKLPASSAIGYAGGGDAAAGRAETPIGRAAARTGQDNTSATRQGSQSCDARQPEGDSRTTHITQKIADLNTPCGMRARPEPRLAPRRGPP
jgi:SsrA-binding protein